MIVRSRSVASRSLIRGYTIVELLMSLFVLAIGATGVLAMQKVTIASNRHAKSLTVATRIAEAWAEQLAADATLWTPNPGGASTLDKTVWLKLATPTATLDWHVPDHSTTLSFGPAFGPLGNPVNSAENPALAHFCTHLRIAVMHEEDRPTFGNGVLRAQIRVFWRRDDSKTDPPGGANICSVNGPVFQANEDAFNVLYLTTAVRQSPRGMLAP